MKSSKFKGSSTCANLCGAAVLAESDAEMAEVPAELEVDTMTLVEDEAISDEDWSLWGTTEKCCRCKSGTKGCSASGKCSFCKGRVAKTKSVSKDCTKKSSKFKGSSKCASLCGAAVLAETDEESLEMTA